jgi:hypothetical protein
MRLKFKGLESLISYADILYNEISNNEVDIYNTQSSIYNNNCILDINSKTLRNFKLELSYSKNNNSDINFINEQIFISTNNINEANKQLKHFHEKLNFLENIISEKIILYDEIHNRILFCKVLNELKNVNFKIYDFVDPIITRREKIFKNYISKFKLGSLQLWVK